MSGHIDAESFLNLRAVLRINSVVLGRITEYRLMCDNKKYWIESLVKNINEGIQQVQQYPLDWEEATKHLEQLKISSLPLALASEPLFDSSGFDLSIFGLCTEFRIRWWGNEPPCCGVITNFADWLVRQTKETKER